MKKQAYQVFRAVERPKLIGFLDNLFRRPPRHHYVVKIYSKHIPNEDLWEILEKYREKIARYTRERSLVFVPDDYDDPDRMPAWLSLAPTEEEASDLIEFEQIERDLNF